MYRAPLRPPRSHGDPRPAGRFPSPASCWGFSGALPPYGGSGPRGGSPRGCPPISPGSPLYSPGSHRGYRGGSPGGGARGLGAPRHIGGGYRRPHSFSPGSAPKFQSGSSDTPVERYFSPSMLQDPWKSLQPITAAARRTT